MNIILKKLHMENFKIFQNKTIDFSMLTKIFAQNYKGKSSIVDAFSWVLFGKSSTGNSEGKQFHPRRYDENGIDIDHVDITVELLLDVDGREITIRKVQKQNWVRKRGAEEETYQGDSNEYHWNEVKVSETEHKKRVAEIIDEELFKMITNPHAFVSKKQDEQRKFLVEKVAQITDDDVFDATKGLDTLRELRKQNTIEEIKAINKKALQGYKEDMESIPIRIDEKSKEIIDMDFSNYELQLNALKEQLNDVESKINDTSNAYAEVNQLKAEISEIQGKMADIERSEKSKLQDARRQVELMITDIERKIKDNLSTQNSTVNALEITKKSIERNKEYLEDSRKQYITINSEQFDDSSLDCPTCGQLLPMEKQEPIKASFEATKKKRLQGVIDQGNLLNESIERDKAKVTELEQILVNLKSNKEKLDGELSEQKAKLSQLPVEVERNSLFKIQQYVELNFSLNTLLEELEVAKENTSSTDTLKQSLLDQKKSIQEQIQTVQGVLGSKKHIDEAKYRVEELRESLRQATNKAAECERLDYQLEQFDKAKMQLLSEKINQKFKVVQWKLFHTQKNGGIENVCIPMIHGSAYGENTTSTTERLMAGLDIINTLQEIYQVKAPIWIDNSEAYNDFNIPKMDCQMIQLFVSEDKEIKVINN